MRAKFRQVMAYVVGILTLTSCTIFEPSDYTESETTETLLGAFNTPDGKMYLLGKNNDYEISNLGDVKDIQLMFRLNTEYAIVDPEFNMRIGDPNYSDYVLMRVYLPQEIEPDKYKKLKFLLDQLKRECKAIGEKYCLYSNQYDIKVVKVKNREQILKNSAFPKSFSVNVDLTKKKGGLRRVAEGAAAGVGNAGVTAVAVVTAPIWIPTLWFMLKDHKGGLFGG